MKKRTKIILIIVLIILLVVFFFPKRFVKGGLGGFIGPGMTAYKEEYSCFGIKHVYYPGCSDCGNIYYCYGMVYTKKCFTEIAGNLSITKEQTECK